MTSEQELLLKKILAVWQMPQIDGIVLGFFFFLHLHYHNHTNLLNKLKIPKNGPQSAYVKSLQQEV